MATEGIIVFVGSTKDYLLNFLNDYGLYIHYIRRKEQPKSLFGIDDVGKLPDY